MLSNSRGPTPRPARKQLVGTDPAVRRMDGAKALKVAVCKYLGKNVFCVHVPLIGREARGREALQMAARHLPLLRRIEVPIGIVPFQIPREGGDLLHAPPTASTAAVAAAAAAVAMPAAPPSISGVPTSVDEAPHVWTPDAPVPVVRGRVGDFFIPQ